MASKSGEVIEVGGKKMKILEMVVDRQTNCIKRTLVPIDTTEEDIPLGGRLLDERETDGHLARSSAPDKLLVGDPVRRKFPQGHTPTEEESRPGTIEAAFKNNRFRVRFEDGTVDKFEGDQLARIW